MFNSKNETNQFKSQRQRLLSVMLKLKSAIDADTQDLATALTERFCDTLVDYLSAGHFQVFQRFVPAGHEYAAIEATTRELMQFNDRFGNGGALDLRELAAALEHTAWVIDTRMELEDDLIRSRARPKRASRARVEGAFAAA